MTSQSDSNSNLLAKLRAHLTQIEAMMPKDKAPVSRELRDLLHRRIAVIDAALTRTIELVDEAKKKTNQ